MLVSSFVFSFKKIKLKPGSNNNLILRLKISNPDSHTGNVAVHTEVSFYSEDLDLPRRKRKVINVISFPISKNLRKE
jgi:hypothetical protein